MWLAGFVALELIMAVTAAVIIVAVASAISTLVATGGLSPLLGSLLFIALAVNAEALLFLPVLAFCSLRGFDPDAE